MKLYDKEMGFRYFIYKKCLPALVIVDLFLITISLIFEIPQNWTNNIIYFDWVVCIILLAEYFMTMFKSASKRIYILDTENLIGLIASIPFDLILIYTPIGVPVFFLRYLRVFKLIRVVKLAQFDYIKELFEKTGLHKILGVIVLVIVLFTILFIAFGPSYTSFDDFYYVIVTLTTVGYGDIYPKTHNEKVLAIILILIGIFVFSTITAAISSFLTDRILDKDDADLLQEIKDDNKEQSESIMNELSIVREENKKLHQEIEELKELIRERD